MTQHAMNVIAAGGLSAIAAATVNVQQMKPAYEARGAAVAETLIAECKAQAGGTWKRFYADVLSLEAHGRKAFRTRISKEVKASKADNADALGKGVRNSAKVRLSEFTQITKALDAGVSFDKEWAFHYAVGFARQALAAAAAAGTTKAGRKAKPFLDKLKKFMVDNAKGDTEMKQALEFITAYAARKTA